MTVTVIVIIVVSVIACWLLWALVAGAAKLEQMQSGDMNGEAGDENA